MDVTLAQLLETIYGQQQRITQLEALVAELRDQEVSSSNGAVAPHEVAQEKV